MFGWISRLIGAPPAAPATPISPGIPAARPATTRPNAPVLTAVAAAVPASASTSFGLRRPLVSTTGSVAGFELLLPAPLQQRLLARGDATALAAHHAALMGAAKPLLAARRAVLMQLNADLLARPALTAQAPSGVMLLVPDLLALPAAVASALRARGVRLGLPDGPPANAPATDFVLLQAAAGGIDTLLLSARRWQEARPRVALVASGLEHVDDVERVLKAGFILAGGHLDRSAQAPVAKPLSAAAHRVCELMNHLALDHDTAVVANSVRADVALSYRLLRYANSPAIGLSRAVDSVEQAVMLLGRAELHRWLSVALLSAATGRKASKALEELALARGRLMEALARLAGEPAPQNLFMLGLLSMLEVLMQLPLATVLAPLRLSESANQALLQQSGPWAPYLQVASALESGDDSRLAPLAEPWGGVEAVHAANDEAWAWAIEVSDHSVASDNPAN